MKFYGDLLADEQALPGVNKNTARTDIVNGRLKVAFHGPAICNQQADSSDFFTSIFSSFTILGLAIGDVIAVHF
jgi:hypothetical protein